MESPTHKIDHPSSSLSVIMLKLSPPVSISIHPPREQELQQESSRRRHGRYQLRYHRFPSVFFCVSRPAALLLAESEPLWSSSQLLLLLLRSLSWSGGIKQGFLPSYGNKRKGRTCLFRWFNSADRRTMQGSGLKVFCLQGQFFQSK